jgi:hypothetical protein
MASYLSSMGIPVECGMPCIFDLPDNTIYPDPGIHIQKKMRVIGH